MNDDYVPNCDECGTEMSLVVGTVTGVDFWVCDECDYWVEIERV